MHIVIFIILFLISPIATAKEPFEPELIEIPAGPFLFGSSPKERSEFLTPSHEPHQSKVFLNTYYIGKFEVTNEEYAFFIDEGGYENKTYWSEDGWRFRNRFSWKEPRCWRDKDYHLLWKEGRPVCAVSWFEAQAYCRWLSLKTNKPYRLPTEQEWEKAARGPNGSIFPWGDEWDQTACNWLGDPLGYRDPNLEIDRNIRTGRVDFYPSGVSFYGCHNMAGNVLEWVDGPFYKNDVSNTTIRIFRGGSFLSGYPRFLRCAWRGGTRPEIGYVYWGIIGFRVAMDAGEEES